MARKKRRGDGSWAERKVTAADDRRDAVLSASLMAMRWRLEEAATRIVEADGALDRGDRDRALERLLDLEPLVFEVERELSAVFLLARETHREIAGRL